MQYMLDRLLPVQVIMAGPDPIVQQGVSTVTGGSQFPVLVSFVNGVTIVKGFQPEAYDNLYKQYLAAVAGAGAPNEATTAEQPAAAPTSMAGESAPKAGGVN